MNKNWKRQILIFTGLCIGFSLFWIGIHALFQIDIQIPWVISFMMECGMASLIEHHWEEKERMLAKKCMDA